MAAPLTLEDLAKEIKSLRKDVRKIRQHLEDPNGEKAKARAASNGFSKPQVVTEKLRSFLGLAADEKISRADVTKRISAYLTEKGLKNGKNITLDAPLKDLLNPPEGTQVTFMNIQKYISPHYVKEPGTEKVTKPKAAKAPKAEAAAEPAKEKASRPKVEKKVAKA
jgi:upstream activation factor subunit UAF30